MIYSVCGLQSFPRDRNNKDTGAILDDVTKEAITRHLL
jgi:hypothetical protein